MRKKSTFKKQISIFLAAVILSFVIPKESIIKASAADISNFAQVEATQSLLVENSIVPNSVYSVKYVGNGNTKGTVPVDSTTYLAGKTVTVKGNTGLLGKTGYTFAGWNTKADGSGTTYQSGATFAIGTANVTLYAKWKINNYTVTFNSNGGSAVSSKSAPYYAKVTKPANPTKAGYAFVGWYKESTFVNLFDFANTPITRNITLYGKWKVNTASTLQDLEKKISAGMHSRQTTYIISYTGSSATIGTDIKKILDNILNADDYLKYTTKRYYYSYSIIGGVTKFNFTFSYWNTAKMDSFVNAKVSEILSKITTPGMNIYQKEKVIYDWIVKNVSYDTTLVKHSDYDALVSPYQTVCQGYALLTYKMMNQAGIKTRIIEGTAGGGGHAWNEVLLDGVWYHLDATWGDPIPDVAGRVLYNYYNLTDSQIKIDHSWTNTYPAANTLFSNKLNSKIISDPANASIYKSIKYAVGLQYLDAAYTVSNATELRAKIQKAIDNNRTSIKVRYMNGSNLSSDVYSAISGIGNITYYSYSYLPYLISTENNDVILELRFSYYK